MATVEKLMGLLRLRDDEVPSPDDIDAVGWAIHKMPPGVFWVLGGPDPKGEFTASVTACGPDGTNPGRKNPTVEFRSRSSGMAMYMILLQAIKLRGQPA